jgi:hypothetical protein
MTVKNEPIALGSALLPALADSVGLYSWDMVANSFCGDAEVARLFAMGPAELSAGVTIERIIGCLHVDDRERIAQALHSAILDGNLCRELYRVDIGQGQYRQVLGVLRCFGYSDGLPTICSGFVYEMQPHALKLTPVPHNQNDFVQRRTLQ